MVGPDPEGSRCKLQRSRIPRHSPMCEVACTSAEANEEVPSEGLHTGLHTVGISSQPGAALQHSSPAAVTPAATLLVALKMGARHLLALAMVALLSLAPMMVWGAEEQFVDPYWRRGRASWYGNQQSSFVTPFVPFRGGGRDAFGIFPWGACGLTNGDGEVQWPLDQVTSYADGNPDYPGSCNRCYEVKCSPGDVLGWGDKPVNYSANYFAFWEHVPNVPDERGRNFPALLPDTNPGNLGSKNSTPTVFVKCWGDDTVVVKVIDLCPCYYYPKNQAPYYQYDCCYKKKEHAKAGQWNFDLGFGAFQKLAHPMYGIMMVDFRAVDCWSHKPIRLEPGYIEDTLYHDRPGVGWAWFPTGQINNNFQVIAKGQGTNGSDAACAELRAAEGGMTWACRGCGGEGYQPFLGTKAVEFWIRDKYHPGSIPNVKVTIGNPDYGKWCNSMPSLRSVTPSAHEGDWYKFNINMGDFNCPELATASQIGFNPMEQAQFCIDELRLVK